MSIIVVAHNMRRELPRTLVSLSRGYQRGVEGLSYEILVVDNGSSTPLRVDEFPATGVPAAVYRPRHPRPSPVGAANEGVSRTRGDLLCIILDGARMVSPGMLAYGQKALQVFGPRCAATPIAFHLGPAHQSESIRQGYCSKEEDRLLNLIAWPNDGYRLFEISALAAANPASFFGPINESCCLFIPRALFEETGGFDLRFESSGGGLANIELFRRLVSHAPLVVIVGEGSFHQIHGRGGVSSAAPAFEEWLREYESITGDTDLLFAPRETYYLGHLPRPSRKWIPSDSTFPTNGNQEP